MTRTPLPAAGSPTATTFRPHAIATLILAGIQLWFWSPLFTSDSYLARSDLYEYFLPTFLAPRTLWSVYELGGFPAFADPQQTTWYPLHMAARLVGSWSFYVMSAYLVASIGAYAYVCSVTRSQWAGLVAGVAWPWSEALADKYPHLSMLHAYAWLPVLLFCLERLGRIPTISRAAAAGVVVALLVLTGHPQASIYCLYLCAAYGVAIGLAERRTRAFFGWLAATFVAGALLSAVQIVPLVEIARQAARVEVSFSQFAESFARTPRELVLAVVPQIAHEGREAPLYVGALPLIAALFAWPWRGASRQDDAGGSAAAAAAPGWRVAFWAVVAAICLLLGLGSATPLADVAYHVPLYDRFRIIARHLVFFSFAAITLGSFGLSALTTGRWRTRWALLPAGVAVALGAGVMAYVASHGEIYEIREGGLLAFEDNPLSELAGQAAVWAVSVGLVLALARWQSRVILVALVAVFAIDLLNRQPVTLLGSRPGGMIPVSSAAPSVHTQWLKDANRGQFQRVLPLEGSSRDPLAMGVFSRVWEVPSAGGYGPLLLSRFAHLTQMEANGSVNRTTLLPGDRALDVLAVRHLIVRASERGAASTVQRAGLPWAQPELELALGRPDCGKQIPGRLELAIPPGSRVRTVALVSHLRCSENLAQGTEVATLALVGGDGQRHSRPLRAGIEVSDSHFGVAGVTPRMKHLAAPIFDRREDGSDGYTATYLARFDFEQPVDAARIELSTPPMYGWWVLNRVTVVDEQGPAYPIGLPDAALGLSDRWRELGRFDTSRDSDREADQDSPGEDGFVVFENLHAMPRAWMVGEVIALSDADGVAALQSSQRPDGTAFDPSLTAFTESADMARQYPGGRHQVLVTSVADSLLRARVSTEHGGLLVLSENWYPGWEADLDGAPAPLVRADYTLMGVAVPPGQHSVTLRFRPRSLFFGAGISLATLMTLAGLLLVKRWR